MAQSGAIYRQIADELREQIRSGELAAGDRLPTEQELGEQYDVSRNTVRLALTMLSNEGMIMSTPGRGTFVRDRIMTTYHASWAEIRDRIASDQADAYRAEVEQQGRQAEYRNFEMRIVSATSDQATRLRVEPGDSLVSRMLVRVVDNQPSSLQDSLYAMDVAQQCGLMVPRDIPKGTIRAMADQGYEEIGYVDEITSRMPSPEEARKLTLSTGTPVIVYIRTTYTADRPLRLTSTVFAGDRNRLMYELGDLTAYYRENVDA